MARRRELRGRGRRSGSRIVAIPTTRAGHDYLVALTQAILQGPMGKLAVHSKARELLEALHRVVTGGQATVEATGGRPQRLGRLLDAHLRELNRINAALGEIGMRS